MKRSSLLKEITAEDGAVIDGAVRAGPLLGIPQLLRDFGKDPAAVFASAAFEPCLLDNPENVVPFPEVGRLLETCVETTACPHFGLLVGQRRGIECLGLVGALARNAPTVMRAVRNIVLYLHLHDRGAVPSLSVGESEASLSYIIYQPGLAATKQIYDAAAAIEYNILRTLCGPRWQPQSVLLPHTRPDHPAPYRRVFGVTPSFDADETAIVFAADWLERPLPDADSALYQVLQKRASDLSANVYRDLPSRVRRITCNLLHCGSGSLESAAEVLSMHPRTLNRRLRRSGTTYRQIRMECTLAHACHLLRETELPITDVAARLEYSSTSAFVRAFRRWSGSTPAVWRVSHQNKG